MTVYFTTNLCPRMHICPRSVFFVLFLLFYFYFYFRIITKMFSLCALRANTFRSYMSFLPLFFFLQWRLRSQFVLFVVHSFFLGQSKDAVDSQLAGWKRSSPSTYYLYIRALMPQFVHMSIALFLVHFTESFEYVLFHQFCTIHSLNLVVFTRML